MQKKRPSSRPFKLPNEVVAILAQEFNAPTPQALSNTLSYIFKGRTHKADLLRFSRHLKQICTAIRKTVNPVDWEATGAIDNLPDEYFDDALALMHMGGPVEKHDFQLEQAALGAKRFAESLLVGKNPVRWAYQEWQKQG